MCGIAGYFLRDAKAELATVRRMCDSIAHRGPDDEGYHMDGGCGIGMRRLSIIALGSGHQPISNEDGDVWVVFNGEIYNYVEVRAWLEGRGHRFRTESDTETLVHLYEEEGAEGIHRLRGMFAYCIWDARRRKLLLARDPLGKKPLYYAALPDGFYFGSELKCLRVAGVPLDVDPEALKLYFQFGYVPDPWSIYKSARKLAPGSWLEYSHDGGVRMERYWKMPAPREEPGAQSEADAQEQLRQIFDESVRLRMIADVPLGAFLSGGIDSSSVVASMARQSSERVKTFSIGFEEAAFNELGYAALVAKQYNTEHHEILVKPDSVDLTTRLIRQFDEPFADSSAIPTYIVSEFAARHVKVALSGDGGDELFGGYDIFPLIPRLESYDRIPGAARSFCSFVADRLPYAALGKNYLHMMSRQTAFERYFERNYAPYQMRRQLLQPDWMMAADGAYLHSMFRDYLLQQPASTLSQALYYETTSKLPGDMLVKVDRMSMAASLEVRCPMLDVRFAEFSATVPNAWKVRGPIGKDILVRALGNRLPPQLLNRPKMGFAIPLAQWLRGPLREMLHDHLESSSLRDRGIVSPGFVTHLLQEHESGRRDNRTWLWSLLVLEMWFRENARWAGSPELVAAR
ncbi:MAG TPA: asparagine synthase (glutamine-hydrolyzing) [Solibacterales bacterium]|nr:asparagine synthase (glutamine-hydrolyzing) [Bryobacterales bacterium]